MPHIYLKVDGQDKVIKKLLSSSVPLTLPMMEGEVDKVILKAHGQNEDDAAPPVAFWGSWLYRSLKVDRAIMNPLAENWQHLLGIFWKFILWW